MNLTIIGHYSAKTQFIVRVNGINIPLDIIYITIITFNKRILYIKNNKRDTNI